MSKLAWIPLPLLVAVARAQDLSHGNVPPAADLEELVRRLQARVESLEAERDGRGRESSAATIDLSGETLPSVDECARDHVLARPWYDNVRLSGYAAFTYLDSGNPGTSPDGSFLVKEASLFVEAEVWRNTFLNSELVLTRFPSSNGVRVGELNLQFSGLFAAEEERGLGLKVGRFEIPFGEEYFRWDANETPFITFSAADPYGVDEGVELYGALGDVNWIVAVTNGSEGTGADDGPSKLAAGKLYAQPFRDVYVSGSVLATEAEVSALRFSGNALAPVGTDGASTAGTSPSDSIEALCWQLDGRLFEERRAGVSFNFGRAELDDVEPFDRGLIWWQVVPRLRIGDGVEVLLRYSEILTDDADEGYRFSGKPVAMGEDLGYDAHALRRASAAVCWTVHPHVDLKLEIGHDWFDLIDASPLEADNDERLFFGLELVGSF